MQNLEYLYKIICKLQTYRIANHKKGVNFDKKF